MAKTIIHTGQFMSISGVLYRVDIWRDNGISGWWPESYGGTASQAPQATAKELRFEADEPLVLEWAETPKEAPLCGSTATLNIESPGDRTYIDLYTIKAGAVGLDVYRDGALYWVGTLDPESYEEPYERADLYRVTLTFSDFGALDRQLYNPTSSSAVTLWQLLQQSATAAGLAHLPIDGSLTSLTLPDGYNVLDQLACRPDNFRDEDGKAQSYREALETMLQPCGLKLMQRAGRLWLHDLHGLATSKPAELVWSGATQTLGVDKVANSVVLNFSPYAQSKLLDSSDLTYPHRVSLSVAKPYSQGSGNAWVYYSDRAAQRAQIGEPRGRGIPFEVWDEESIAREAEFVFAQSGKRFKILPLKGGGGEATGIVVRASPDVRSITRPYSETAEVLGTKPERVAYTTRRVYLPRIESHYDVFLRLKMEALMDVRYNPFAESPDAKDYTDDNNDRPIYNQARVGSAWCFVPVAVKLYVNKDDLTPAAHYDNASAAYFYTSNPLSRGWQLSGEYYDGWKQGAPDGWHAWLAYYPDPDQIREDSALLHGWATNRPNIGRADKGGRTYVNEGDQRLERGWDYDGDKGKALYKWLQKISGELIPYPADGGWLEITIGSGIVIHDYKYGGGANDGDAADTNGERSFFNSKYWRSRGLYDKMQWLLYKAPEVSIVRAWGNYDTIEVDDVEIRATLHPDAREELKIDLKCGTLPDSEGEAVARGIYLQGQSGKPLRQLRRGGITDTPERLLINSLYSQYATRHTKLTGEAYMDPAGLRVYREQNQGRRLFMTAATRQDLYMDCGDVTAIEITPDKYTALDN